MSLSRFDPLARAELEMLAQHWRDVYPAGATFNEEAMHVIRGHREKGLITGAEAGLLYLRVCKFANGESESLDFDS